MTNQEPEVSVLQDVKDNDSLKSSNTNIDDSNTMVPSPVPVSGRRRKGRSIGASQFENVSFFMFWLNLE